MTVVIGTGILSDPHGMLDLMTAQAHSEVLVGREADLGVLRDALKRVRSAEPATVLVGGEAGVGKTRLIEEFCRALAGEPVRLLTGQCLELGEEGLPFAPFAGALRELIRAEGAGIVAGREREFARLLPELGPPPEPGDARRGLLFESVAGLLARLGEEQPMVLVIEDLHWADRSTRDLIGFLVRSARLQQVLLIATYRTDELHRGHPLRPFLAELDRVRGVQRHELARLDRDATAELLTHLLDGEPDAPTVDAVNERAQGNPFFIEQFATSADPGCSDIPTSLRDLLLSRVDLLPEPAQRVLRVAAVGGTRFGHELLSRVAGVDEASLESALRTIVAAQLVVFDPDGGYEFRHALVREAVHDDLLPGEHARLHARYAEAVEAEPHLVAAGRAPAEIAHHWHAAHDRPRALVSAKVAADEAGRRYAYGEQARLLDRVLELWEDVPDAEARLGLRHLDLLEEAALVAIDSAEHMRALSLTRAALGDLDAEAEPLRAARLLVRRAKLLRNAGKSDGLAECEEAYRLLVAAEPGTDRVRLMADVANIIAGHDFDRANEIARTAMADAAALGDLALLVSTEVTSGSVCSGRVPADEALPTIQAAVDRARVAGDLQSLARSLVNVSDALFEVGRYEESAAAAAEGVPHADRVGVSRSTGAYLLANHAEALIALGRWDEADVSLTEAARLDPPDTLALPWLRLSGMLRLARGRDDTDAVVQRTFAFLGRPYLTKESRLSILDLRLVAALASGDTGNAVALAHAALDDGYFGTLPRYSWSILAHAARIAADHHDVPLAARVTTAAAALPTRHPAWAAFAATVTALVEGGPSRWQSAVEAWRTDGQRHELARTLLDLAESQAADRPAAADAIAEATAIATELGATPLLEAAETLARRLGIRPAAPAAAGTEILTARERDVLRLVAEGLSNSRIAASLYISPKTASVHVSRIIAKLEVSNRVEAAAVAHRLGLLGD